MSLKPECSEMYNFDIKNGCERLIHPSKDNRSPNVNVILKKGPKLYNTMSGHAEYLLLFILSRRSVDPPHRPHV